MRTNLVARLGLTATAVAAALAGVLAVPETAGATAQTRCWIERYFSWDSPGVLGAYLERECVGPESVRPLDITMQRYTPETDTWTTVATGRGHAAYSCTGTAPHYFHMTAVPDDYVLADCS